VLGAWSCLRESQRRQAREREADLLALERHSTPFAEVTARWLLLGQERRVGGRLLRVVRRTCTVL
jgi:hypothetical protein